MQWTQSTPPTQTFIDVPTLRTHLRLSGDITAEQTYILSLVDAATEYAETAMACSLMPRTITTTWYTDDVLYLPRGPIIALGSIQANGATQDPSSYLIESAGKCDRLRFNFMYRQPYLVPMVATYTAGYTDGAIPADIRHAILAHVGTLYERRESIVAERRIEVVPHSLEAFYQRKSRDVGIG